MLTQNRYEHNSRKVQIPQIRPPCVSLESPKTLIRVQHHRTPLAHWKQQSSQNLQVSSYVLMYLRAFRTYKSVVIYSCISANSELASQQLCTHVSQSIQNLQVSSYVLMYLRAVRTYMSVVMYSCTSEQSELTRQQLCTHVSQRNQNLQVISYVLMYLRAFITYKSVVMY